MCKNNLQSRGSRSGQSTHFRPLNMYLTYKAKITTDKKIEAILENFCFSATKLYNTINWYLRSEWEHQRALCDYLDTIGYPHSGVKMPLNRTFLQNKFKNNHWASSLHSQSAQFIVGEVINAYKSFFSLRKNGNSNAKPPGFRRKTSLSPVTFIQGAPTIFSGKFEWEGVVSTHRTHATPADKKDNTYLRLSLGTKRADGLKEITVKITHRKPLPEYNMLKNVGITYDTVTGTYYAHLVFDVEVKTKQQPQLFPTDVVAIDLGLNNIITATFSDGTSHISSGRELKAIRRYWQKVRAKVKPPSITKRKPSRRYRRICHKETRQIAHRLHIISKQFVSLCDEKGITHIVLGDLNGIRENIDYSKKLNQQLHNWSFAKLIGLMTYKAEKVGIITELISEKYTSQTCCKCGIVKKSNRKTRGLYFCNCGNRINADRNGANNILTKYLRYRSSGSVALPVVTLALSRTDAHCLRIYNQSRKLSGKPLLNLQTTTDAPEGLR